MPSYDEEEYMAVIATIDDAKASLDWNLHTRPELDTTDFGTSAAYSAGRSPIAHLDELPFIELPFILDSRCWHAIYPLKSPTSKSSIRSHTTL